MEASWQHSPIDSSKREIRLLRLPPRQNHTAAGIGTISSLLFWLSCTKDRILSFIYPYREHRISYVLETATLDHALKYIALSYAWGNPSLVRQLMIVRSESGRVNLELKL